MKTHELSGINLDVAVAVALKMGDAVIGGFNPSGRWHDAGPLIDEYKISIHAPVQPGEHWYADLREYTSPGNWQDRCEREGRTPLEAAMRCLLAWKNGEVDLIPYEERITTESLREAIAENPLLSIGKQV